MGAMRWQVFQAVAAVLMLGCGSEAWEAPPPDAVPSERQVTGFGSNLNGSNLNGSNLNGSNLNGSNLNGRVLAGLLVSVDFAGARRDGRALDAVWLEGSVFHGLSGRRELSGADFAGVSFWGNLGSGQKVALRVDAVAPGSGESADVWTYRVSYRDALDANWRPLCRTSTGAPAGAIPVEGRWDYRQGVPGGGSKIHDPAVFTFACEGAAIAKCVRYGYKPWASVRGVSLAEHHQACTRLIRADFCGDGTSHTVDGQWVNLYDAAGVQEDTEPWGLEAEWDAQGARCFSGRTRAHQQVVCPQGRTQPVCGARRAFNEGALLMSEVPLPWGRNRSRFNVE